MRTLFCTGILLMIGAVFFAVHDMLSRTIPSMFQMAVGSMLIAAILAGGLLRWTELRRFGLFGAIGFSGVSVFPFFSSWITLWFVSEQLLIDYYSRIRGDGDTGYNHFYLGASGAGYAEGLSQPDKIISRILWVGGVGAGLLSVPMGVILSAFKKLGHPGQNGHT